jgi:hypothetical protein
MHTEGSVVSGASKGSHRPAEREVDAEDSRPETRGVVVVFSARTHRERLQDEYQQGQAHGELRKDVIKSGGKGELQSMDVQCGVHGGKAYIGEPFFNINEQSNQRWYGYP